MLYKKIQLRPDDPSITLTTYVADERFSPRDALLVIPGGGYRNVSPREGEPIALAFGARGYNTFVLHYSINEKAVFPRPLADASLAMQYIREHAEELNVNPERVFAVGFSAGGHLTGALGTMWNAPELRAALPEMPEGINRPTGMILCYAVLSMTIERPNGSFYGVLGTDQPDEEQRRRYSLDLLVDEGTAPAFFFHTFDDPAVDIDNTIVMMQALADKNIPFESHIYPHGPHGLALATPATANGNPDYVNPVAARWIEDADVWMQGIGKK